MKGEKKAFAGKLNYNNPQL